MHRPWRPRRQKTSSALHPRIWSQPQRPDNFLARRADAPSIGRLLRDGWDAKQFEVKTSSKGLFLYYRKRLRFHGGQPVISRRNFLATGTLATLAVASSP